MLENILVATSIGFISPVFLLDIPIWLQYSLFFTTCISSAFWSDPNKHRNSILHYIDALMARIMITTVFFYALWQQNENLSLLFFMTSIMIFFFYLSDQSSSKEWCSHNHIIYHGLAHISAIIATIISL